MSIQNNYPKPRNQQQPKKYDCEAADANRNTSFMNMKRHESFDFLTDDDKNSTEQPDDNAEELERNNKPSAKKNPAKTNFNTTIDLAEKRDK
jgi:hypothetical protein